MAMFEEAKQTAKDRSEECACKLTKCTILCCVYAAPVSVAVGVWQYADQR